MATPLETKTIIEISTASVLKVILIILFFVLLYLLRDIIIIVLFAVVIASAVGPFANWLDRRRVPRILGVLALYLVIFGLTLFLLSLIIPFVSAELGQLTLKISKFVNTVSGVLEKAQDTGRGYFNFLGEVQNLLEGGTQYLQALSQSTFGLIIGIFGGIFSFFAIVILSFYLSVTRHGIDGFLKSIVPIRYEEYIMGLWLKTERKVGQWFQAQLLLGLTVGVAVYIGLSLMHIKFALLLAIIAMVLELIPTVGPVLSAIPGVMLAFLQSPALGLWVIVFYIVVQQAESHVLTPLILGKSLGINPISVIISLLIGFKLASILGMILAVPVATIIIELIDDFARQKESRKATLIGS